MHTMFTPDQIPEIEIELKRRDLTAAGICKQAGIDPSLWSRWKQRAKQAEGDKRGTGPTYENWMKVAAVLADKLGEPVEGRAA